MTCIRLQTHVLHEIIINTTQAVQDQEKRGVLVNGYVVKKTQLCQFIRCYILIIKLHVY